ncbi:rCG62763 [Rattus norvegicus]|uniref:RCG62763 n=1 Tax=Rattus norvegicus TaxID=10116 RepID=A6J5Y8_RAT|nr:rCG62763 [Rattus norvegicus]
MPAQWTCRHHCTLCARNVSIRWASASSEAAALLKSLTKPHPPPASSTHFTLPVSCAQCRLGVNSLCFPPSSSGYKITHGF